MLKALRTSPFFVKSFLFFLIIYALIVSFSYIEAYFGLGGKPNPVGGGKAFGAYWIISNAAYYMGKAVYYLAIKLSSRPSHKEVEKEAFKEFVDRDVHTTD